MGAEQSADLEGKGGLATEILKLKAAKSGGWLSEEEFDTEVKRLIREHNGEAREPAYAFNDVVGIMGDEVQMAEWEARYGDAAAGDRAGEGGHRPPPLAVEQAGSVELDLTGGVAVPSAVNSLLQEIEAEGGASIADLSDMQQGGHERGQGDEGVEAAEEGVEAASGREETSAIGGEATTTVEDAEATPIKDAPTTPKAQQVPTSDEMDEI